MTKQASRRCTRRVWWRHKEKEHDRLVFLTQGQYCFESDVIDRPPLGSYPAYSNEYEKGVMDDLESWKALARQHKGITKELAAFVSCLDAASVPASTGHILSLALIDALGCGLYGLTTPWGRILSGFVQEQGGLPEAGLWGSNSLRVSAGNAALLAGTAIHSFDFDDHSRAKIHPGAAVIPVVLALGERLGSSGEDCLAAMAAGYEVMNRVSQASNPGRARMRGWHLTGTAGTLGAAAAASVLLRLDDAMTASALGLAGTQSAGLWAFTADGGMSKRLHPGRAAQAGITAALLAQRGFLGPRYILEAEDGGLLFAMSDSPRPAELLKDLGSRWHTEETCFKPHSCCGSNHACIDATIALVEESDIRPEDIECIVAAVPSVVTVQTGFEYMADSVLNAQMSLRYNVAVAAVDHQAYLEQFTSERIRDPLLLDMTKRVKIEVEPELDRLYPAIYGGMVTIVTRSGKQFSRRVDYSKGMPENPMSSQEIQRKFMSLATASAGQEHAGKILEYAKDLFNAGSVAPLNAAMACAPIHMGSDDEAKAHMVVA